MSSAPLLVITARYCVQDAVLSIIKLSVIAAGKVLAPLHYANNNSGALLLLRSRTVTEG